MLSNIENILRAHKEPEPYWESFKKRQPEVAALALHVPRTPYFLHLMKEKRIFRATIEDSLDDFNENDLSFLGYNVFSGILAVMGQSFSDRDLVKLVNICPYSFFQACSFVYDNVERQDEEFSEYIFNFMVNLIVNTFHYAYPVRGLKEAVENYIGSMEISAGMRNRILSLWGQTYNGQTDYLVH